jgi:Zn finger protein HypA/HybF involved in hydrogenase expression
MIQKGDGTFSKLYEQGRCPRCRGYLQPVDDVYVCEICKMIHIGVENGNRKKPKDGVADDK